MEQKSNAVARVKSGNVCFEKRVPRHKILRLYESDACGMLDTNLLDDVGYNIYTRCQDILEVTEAADKGRVKCRECGEMIVRREGKRIGYKWIGGKTESLRCENCSWQITWGEYFDSYSGQHLLGGAAERLTGCFSTFIKRWPKTQSAQEKMLLIDDLIHIFHVHGDIGRSAGVNVIRGTEKQVTELIEQLAYGGGSTGGLSETRQRWLSHFEERKKQLNMPEIQAIARELGIKEYKRLRRADLITAIEAVDPGMLNTNDRECGNES